MPCRWLLAAVLLLPWPAVAEQRPARQEIGSWVLSCPGERDAAPCQLRHRSWLLPPAAGTPTAALEVMPRGGQLVPAVVVRGVSTQAALGIVMALQAQASLRFDAAPPTELDCQPEPGAVICAPITAQLRRSADALAGARSVQVEVRLTLPPGTALPDPTRSLELQRTADALARFRSVAPAGPTEPTVAGLDWRGFLDRMARDAGWEHGLADLLPKVGRLVGVRPDL